MPPPRPDLPQMRAALVHAPDLAAALLRLHRAYARPLNRLSALSQGTPDPAGSHEALVHMIFRRNRNHVRDLETAAEGFWQGPAARPRTILYARLRRGCATWLGM